MKKIIAENGTDALVIDELPKVKPIIQPAKKAVSEDSGDDTDSSLVDEKLAKRKSLLKNISKSSRADASKGVAGWQQQLNSLEKKLIANTIPSNDLMIFELNTDNTVLKTKWSSLPLRLKEVFEEIIYSLPMSGISHRDDDGCYTFSYTDDEFDLSVISIVMEGKAALFYKNAAGS